MEAFLLGWSCSLGWFFLIIPIFIVKKAFSISLD